MKIIDAHQHYWHYNQSEYDWIDDSMKVLQQDFLPSHYKEEMKDNNIHGSVVVQARQSDQETKWLLDLADHNEHILGIVGWIDLKSKNLEHQLKEYKTSTKLKGFRHVIHDELDIDFMLDLQFINGLRLLNEYNYTYDLLIKSEHLENTIRLIEQLPKMKLVIDHIAKPNIKKKEWDTWAIHLKKIANDYPHVYCKISGFVTEADWYNWKEEELIEYIKYVIDIFGPSRVMFGTDWPVCQVASKVNKIIGLCEKAIYENNHNIQCKLFNENASLFYSL
ncbi:amidohydrolase [Photobacterium sp. GB-36]|uniref:amidohydrolase family protein n=1 Tax=Photobacterium sp. GB-36 TaxID=2022108 RepID=UPI000D17E6C4|nr:amidohydrolase family protein [Photobacterium sp. GB-36]PSV48050.1 amidohydrolase [Photobacterium sp. GB-36]